MKTDGDPHGGQPVVHEGAPIDEAEAAVVLLHGRGATAESVLSFTDAFGSEGVAYLAPEAKHREWFPWSFTAPVEENQPKIGSALRLVGDLYGYLRDADIPSERVGFVGFSQGACVGAEYVARNPREYGGVGILSGGVVGHDVGFDDYDGSLKGTPVFVGCGDDDDQVPVGSVHRTVGVFESLRGDVTERVYEGMEHTVLADEVEEVARIVDSFA